MNKAKITYRFDAEKNHLRPIRQTMETKNAIPLHPTPSDADLPNAAEEAAPGNKDLREPPPIYDVQPLNQFTSDFGAWSSPFDIETEKLEKLIRESDSNMSDRPASGMSSRQAADRYERPRQRMGPDISEVSFAQFSKRSSHKFPSWGKMILSASSAIITGVLLGTFFINMFPASLDNTNPIGGTSALVETPAADIPDQAGGNGSETANGIGAIGEPVLTPVQLASAEYYFLQNGVFSTEESAAEAQSILRDKGLASVVDASDGYRVFAGFSSSRDEALFLSNWIEQQELETYIKPISRPEVTVIEWPEGNQRSFEDYINGSTKLISAMSAWTSQLLRNDDLSFSNEHLNELKQMHQAWSGHAASVSGAAPSSEIRAHLGKMNAFMNTAVESFAEYSKHPNHTYLWQAQTAMMQYIFLERSLLAAVTPA